VARNWCADTDYRIGDAADTLVRLKDLGISAPDQVVFQPAAMYYVRGDLARVGDGHITAVWVWDMISNWKLANLLEYLNGEDYADVYIYTDRRDGTYHQPSQAFATYSVRMWKPLIYGPEGIPLARSPYIKQTVRITFKKVLFWAGYIV